MEIEKIMGKRLNKTANKVEYLVRWKGLEEEEDQWVAEELFDELKIINEFNEQLNNEEIGQAKSKVAAKKRGPKGHKAAEEQ